MRKYTVASISFLDNEIKMSIQLSNNRLEAFKQHQLDLCKDDNVRFDEQEWQDSEDYPKSYDELLKDAPNWDMDINIIEIK